VSKHLTDEELDAVMMGAESRALHLEECAVCREKLAEMRAMVTCFREGTLLWESSPRMHGEILPLRQAQGQNDNSKKYSWMAVPAFGLAAALAVGVMVPHWMHERSASLQDAANRRAAQALATSVPANDVLMQQVQQQLDEDVPASMAPLTALIQTDEPRAGARKPMRQEKVN